MKKLRPIMYQESIYKINYQKLKEKGVKCLLFDLDNTCVGYHEKTPNPKLKKLFKNLKEQGFNVIIFSNAPQKRLQPFNTLNVILHPSSKKPLRRNFEKILKEYNFKKEEVCIIGDQLFTDILGGNKVGIITCLVNPLTTDDFILTKVFRKIEKFIFVKMNKQGHLIKGEYYE